MFVYATWEMAPTADIITKKTTLTPNTATKMGHIWLNANLEHLSFIKVAQKQNLSIKFQSSLHLQSCQILVLSFKGQTETQNVWQPMDPDSDDPTMESFWLLFPF